MKKKFYEFCGSNGYTVWTPAIILGIMFLIALCLSGSEGALTVMVIIMVCFFFLVALPLFLMRAWYAELTPEQRKYYESGAADREAEAAKAAKRAASRPAAQAKPAAAATSTPVQVHRAKTTGNADTGNCSSKTVNASLTVRKDPATGTQSAVLEAEKYRTKTTTKAVNLSHQHDGKSSSQSVTVTAYRYKTTTSYEKVVVEAVKQKAPASARSLDKTPKELASTSGALVPVDEDECTDLHAMG